VYTEPSFINSTFAFLWPIWITPPRGILLVICDELKVSIKYLGTSKGLDDLVPFHPQAFV
jgi:hypothetical protein